METTHELCQIWGVPQIRRHAGADGRCVGCHRLRATTDGEETVVVTATVAPESLGNVGRSLEIISGDEVPGGCHRFIADALRLVASIEARSRGPLGVQSDFSVRVPRLVRRSSW